MRLKKGKTRAQAIIIQNKEVLYEYGESGEKSWRFFLGGSIEESETPEQAILREIGEEAGVRGTIVFQLSKEIRDRHFTFLVDIGTAECLIGTDPEYQKGKQHLQKLIWLPLTNKLGFNKKDLAYFKILYKDCLENNYYPVWLDDLRVLVAR